MNDLLDCTIQWRWAGPSDWPSKISGRDFKLAKQEGFGFVTEIHGLRMFLIPRGFDWPEWAIASHDERTGSWTRLGCLEPEPYGWFLPALEDRQVAD